MTRQGYEKPMSVLIYEELRAALETQQRQAQNLETKASVLIGFAGAILALLLKTDTNLASLHWGSALALIIVVILVLLSLILLYRVYGVRKMYIAPDPLELCDYLQASPQEFCCEMIKEQQKSWSENNKDIESRARYLKAAFIVQSIGIFFVAATLLLMIFEK